MAFCLIFTFNASADTGPKPSVNITFHNMGSEKCYATLLSDSDSSGPARAWNGKEAPDYYVWEGDGVEYNEDDSLHKDIWQKMADYTDSDGYYFLQRIWRVDETKELKWTYYPPDTFKLLLYYPKTDTFVSSGIYESYAFDSYFTVNMEGITIAEVNHPQENSTPLCGTVTAEESYDYKWEAISLLARILITILLETGIALLFSYKTKKELTIIGIVNIVTQIILNVALNIINYQDGYMAFTAYYIFLEIVVFALEAAIYCARLKSKKKSRNILYALTSNAISFGVGLWLAHIIPGIF
ncbi:MAG: hypothetical protein IJ491_09590 [Clostridia bacterium]|nr:hypothetical protein [Clostridia bacterium]